jgi:hypothetical protein
VLDDMNNWGLPKRLLAETDMFAIDHTSELYTHMNANYVRIGSLPDFDHYGGLMDAVSRGDYFISTGEVLLPQVEVSRASASRSSGSMPTGPATVFRRGWGITGFRCAARSRPTASPAGCDRSAMRRLPQDAMMDILLKRIKSRRKWQKTWRQSLPIFIRKPQPTRK